MTRGPAHTCGPSPCLQLMRLPALSIAMPAAWSAADVPCMGRKHIPNPKPVSKAVADNTRRLCAILCCNIRVQPCLTLRCSYTTQQQLQQTRTLRNTHPQAPLKSCKPSPPYNPAASKSPTALRPRQPSSSPCSPHAPFKRPGEEKVSGL